MGFLGNILKAAVEIVTLPVAVVQDTTDVLDGIKPNNTKEGIKSTVKNVANGINDLLDGNI